MRGNCYAASEALWHTLGGEAASNLWKPMVMRTNWNGPNETHWFLRHATLGLILDPSVQQFGGMVPDYSRGRGCGFLTRQPSKRAQRLLERMTWQTE